MSEDYPASYGDTERPRQGTYFDVIFGIIVVLASGFSAYTTYIGFSYDIPPFLAITLATIIGLGLLGINFRIRDARRSNLSLAGPLAAFLVIFVFSFVSNTNAIYTYFLQRDIVGQTQEEAWRVFDSETNKVLSEINGNSLVQAFAERREALQIARRNLKRQIVDERNPGLGSLARVHLDEVTNALGSPLTPLRPPDPTAMMSEHERYAERLDLLIEQQAKTAFANDPAAAILELESDIRKWRSFYEQKNREREYDRDITDLMNRDLNKIQVQTRDLLNAELELERINNTADETGSFQYTWTNFINWISPAAIVLSVLLGALLDIIAPLLSILLYRPDEVY